MTFIVNSLAETKMLAQKIAKALNIGDVILLNGDLGAGKTTLVKCIAEELGVQEVVTSPTFTLLNEYQGRVKIFHFDMYRLKDSEEARAAGLDEVMNCGEGVIFVEWGENVPDILPQNSKIINITKLQNDIRQFDVEGLF